MTDDTARRKLALYGGERAVSRIEGRGRPEPATEEFISIAELFGFSQATCDTLYSALNTEAASASCLSVSSHAELQESKVLAIEDQACRLFKTKYALGVNSTMGALHTAFAAAGCTPGSEVICSAIGFYTTAAAVIQANAIPIFCDIDDSLGMDPHKIDALITPRTVAIAPAHVMGSVCDIQAITKIARKHKLRVIEDATQTTGAKFKNRYVGTYGDLGCLGISSPMNVGGESGLILSKTKQLWHRANLFAESGGLWRPDRFTPPRESIGLFAGTNYRMPEFEAAVNLVQIKRLTAFVRGFRTVKHRILKRLKTYTEILPQRLVDPEGEIGYTIRLFPETAALGKRIVRALVAEGVNAHMHSSKEEHAWHHYSYMLPAVDQGKGTSQSCTLDCPLYRKRGGRIGYALGDCPVADDLYERMVGIGLNRHLTGRDCQRIAKAINKVLDVYCTPAPKGMPWL